MIDEPIPGEEDDNINPEDSKDLEAQEQLNDENLIRQIEEENRDPEVSDAVTSEETMGAQAEGGELEAGGRVGEEAALEYAKAEERGEMTPPPNKNLPGDNPPGSEDLAFESDHPGDLNAGEAKYIADDIEENFQENIDKTESEIKLDKKLKEDEEDTDI